MTADPTSLHGRALLAYGRIVMAQLDEARLYWTWPLPLILQLKLEQLFAVKEGIALQESAQQHAAEAVVEDLRFVGRWRMEGLFEVRLVAPCPNCEERMESEAVLDVTELGQELVRLRQTGGLGCHR